MDDSTALFSRLRPRLFGVAYRMLGSSHEAEDVVQDVWLRWHGADQSQIENPEAWLVATTTRRAIDGLRLARHAREHYVGMWLPEPLLTDDTATPEYVLETASDLSVAFLSVLERLAPDARAAFLLHDVFDQDYAVVARALDKTEAACRQIVHRARQQLRQERPRYNVPQDVHQKLLRRFAEAASSGDFRTMKALMAESAELVGDGGGIVTSFPGRWSGAHALPSCCMPRTCGAARNCGWSRPCSMDGWDCCAISMACWRRRWPSRPMANGSRRSWCSATRTSCSGWLALPTSSSSTPGVDGVRCRPRPCGIRAGRRCAPSKTCLRCIRRIRSEVPEHRYPAERLALQRHPAH